VNWMNGEIVTATKVSGGVERCLQMKLMSIRHRVEMTKRMLTIKRRRQYLTIMKNKTRLLHLLKLLLQETRKTSEAWHRSRRETGTEGERVRGAHAMLEGQLHSNQLLHGLQ